MADDYTPTTEQVRGGFASSPMAHEPRETAEAEFDRWLTRHDQEVAATALTEAADEMDADYEERTVKSGAYGQTKIRAALLMGAGMVRNRADKIRRTELEGNAK